MTLWALALITAVQRGSAALMAWILLALYWGTQVIKNVVHTTAAGVGAAVRVRHIRSVIPLYLTIIDFSLFRN